MQSNRKNKAGIQYSHLHLSAQVKDVLAAYHKKGTWKSKTGKMTRTLTGETMGKANVMTEDDIDRLFQDQGFKKKQATQMFEVRDHKNFTKIVKFLQIEDEHDKLLTGLEQEDLTEDRIEALFQQKDPVSDLTAEFKKNYMVGKVIGEGAYASVRVAIHKPTNKKIAIKVYEKSKIKQIQRKKSVRREVKILECLQHPNIMEILDVVETNNHLNIITEYLPGLSLGGYLKAHPAGRIPEKDCLQIFRGLAEALSFMHSLNIAHRDIKLENIILLEDLTPKLIDFGFSTCIEPGKKVKIFCGTPSYMAPEVVQRREYRGECADIWALGVLLFVSLTGIFPFKGSTDQQLYGKINTASYSKMQVMFSPMASDLIARMLTISPDSRITANEILTHPWMNKVRPILSSTIKMNCKKSKEKEKSNDNRKRICTVSSMSSKQGKWALRTSTKKGLAETCKDNLQQEIRMAMKSPKGREEIFSYRKIEKQNHVRQRTRVDSRPLEQLPLSSNTRGSKLDKRLPGNSAVGKNQSKVIDLLRVEMKKRNLEISAKSKSNKRV